MLAGAAKHLAQAGPRLLIELHGSEPARQVLRMLLDLAYHTAGAVSEKLHPAGYGPLDATHISRITEPYDLHFLLAAKDPADLPTDLPH